jgi:hypothetical protein
LHNTNNNNNNNNNNNKWKQAVQTDREVTANRIDIIITKKEKTCMLIDGNTRGQKCRAKGSGKEAKVQEFMYRGTTNVEHVMYDYTGKIGATRTVTKVLKKNLEAMPGKDSIESLQKTTRNITHNTESTAV